MSLTAAVANHLNIVESMIIEVQEWVNCLWVRFSQGKPRFVSKKVKPQEGKLMKSEVKLSKTEKQLETIKTKDLDFAKYWENHGKKRIYFDLKKLLELSNNEARKRTYDKFYFDSAKGFSHSGLSDSEFNVLVDNLQWILEPSNTSTQGKAMTLKERPIQKTKENLQKAEKIAFKKLEKVFCKYTISPKILKLAWRASNTVAVGIMEEDLKNDYRVKDWLESGKWILRNDSPEKFIEDYVKYSVEYLIAKKDYLLRYGYLVKKSI